MMSEYTWESIPESKGDNMEDKMFKFDLGQKVFYMRNNKVGTAPINRRLFIVEESGYGRKETTTYTVTMPNGNEDCLEKALFITKEDLLASL